MFFMFSYHLSGCTMRNYVFTLISTLWLVTGCSNTPATNSAWSNYDYRFPVPLGTGLPDTGYGQDNDDNYTQPQGYGCMGDTGQVC